jgi:hypothetical protein
MKQRHEPYSFDKRTVTLPRVSFDEVLKDPNPIIFDTNFLFVPFEFTIDIISNIEHLVGKNYSFYIYEGTLSELKNIEKKKDKNKKFLPLITTMLSRYQFKIITSNQEYIDDQILENADKGVLIATNDKELRQKLWKIPCKVLYMRQKSYLEIR